MKKFPIVLFIVIGFNCAAQSSFMVGPDAGFLSQYKGPRIGISAGFALKVKMTDQLSFDFLGLYSHKGANLIDTIYNINYGRSIQLNVIEFPVFLSYKDRSMTYGIGAGPCVTLLSRNKYREDIDRLGFMYVKLESIGIDYPIYFKAQKNFTIDSRGVYLQAMYSHGLVNQFKGQGATRTIYFHIGINLVKFKGK